MYTKVQECLGRFWQLPIPNLHSRINSSSLSALQSIMHPSPIRKHFKHFFLLHLGLWQSFNHRGKRQSRICFNSGHGFPMAGGSLGSGRPMQGIQSKHTLSGLQWRKLPSVPSGDRFNSGMGQVPHDMWHIASQGDKPSTGCLGSFSLDKTVFQAQGSFLWSWESWETALVRLPFQCLTSICRDTYCGKRTLLERIEPFETFLQIIAIHYKRWEKEL